MTVATAKQSKRKISCKDIKKVSIDELIPYLESGDPKLPIKKGTVDEIDVCKIPGNLLLKLAARYGEAKKIVAVEYSHCNASITKNHYQSTMLLIDRSKIDLPARFVIVCGESIGVNGFVAVSPSFRKELQRLT